MADPATAAERLPIIAAVVSALIGSILWAGPAIWRADIFDGDAAHHVFWLYQYSDAALFPNDLSVHYLRTSAPLGYRALYGSLAPFFDALVATEWLSIVLLLSSCWLAWKLATAVAGPGLQLRGLLAVVSLILLVSLGQSTGGILPPIAFQRTFALPLTLLCLWGLVNRHYLWVGISWLGSALFYPVMLPVLGLTGGIVFLHKWVRTRQLPDRWLVNGVLGVGALLAALFGMPRADDLGPAATYEQAIAMPEFGPGGRLVLYASGFVSNLLRFHMTGIGWSPYVLAAIALSVVAVWASGHRRLIPGAAWVMLGVGLLLWLAMRIFPEELMFGLYLPNRHSRWAVAAFGVSALSAGTYCLTDLVGRRLFTGGLGDRAGFCTTTLSIAAPLLVVLALAPRAYGQWQQPVDNDLERTYAFIGSLPKDTLVAAHPDLANYIPLRARRSVLTSTEVSMPWLPGYYAQMEPRLEASLRAAYSTDINQVDMELARYGVDVFVTGPAVWARQGYLQPLDSMVRGLQARGTETGFVLKSPPPDRVLFRSGDYYVIGLESREFSIRALAQSVSYCRSVGRSDSVRTAVADGADRH